MRWLRRNAVQKSTSRLAPLISLAKSSRSASPLRGEKPTTSGASAESGFFSLIQALVAAGSLPAKRSSNSSR